MNHDERKKVRDFVEKNNFNIIWAGGYMPCYLLNEKVELLYENMDGRMALCDAVYTIDEPRAFNKPYFRRTDGAHMVQCIVAPLAGCVD